MRVAKERPRGASSMAPREEEIVLPLPSPRSAAPRATKMRGAWLISSQRGLREAGLFDRYMGLLPEEHRAQIESPAVSDWLPIDVAIAHYGACDRLELPVNQLVEFGLAATRYAHSTLIGVTAKLAVGSGATPWTIFGQAQRLWDRTFIGGVIGVAKLGPKEARIELVGWPCAGFRYTRIGMRGVIRGATEYFCTRAYTHEIEALCTPLTLGYQVSWA